MPVSIDIPVDDLRLFAGRCTQEIVVVVYLHRGLLRVVIDLVECSGYFGMRGLLFFGRHFVIIVARAAGRFKGFW